jgi:hypothetical protein
MERRSAAVGVAEQAEQRVVFAGVRGGGPRRGRLALAALGLLGLGGAGAWAVLQPHTPARQATAARAPAPESPEEAASLGQAEAEALLRAALAGLSEAPAWAAWLAEEGLARRLVGVAVTAAEGESPRELLGGLGPRAPFTVREEGERTTVAPESYARYDAVGAVARALPVEGLVAVYWQVRPFLARLHREGAPPGRTLEADARRACERVLAVPLPTGDEELVLRGAVWAYTDPALESLTPFQKHLLRMGPDTVRALQERAREVVAALDRRVASR